MHLGSLSCFLENRGSCVLYHSQFVKCGSRDEDAGDRRDESEEVQLRKNSERRRISVCLLGF